MFWGLLGTLDHAVDPPHAQGDDADRQGRADRSNDRKDDFRDQVTRGERDSAGSIVVGDEARSVGIDGQDAQEPHEGDILALQVFHFGFVG